MCEYYEAENLQKFIRERILKVCVFNWKSTKNGFIYVVYSTKIHMKNYSFN